jgi:hypothetical protein
MKKQKIDIYHHGDLDGVFSAIMLAKSYLDNNVECKFRFTPVNYDQKDWQTKELPIADVIAVVDFVYHPQATIWYDHHLSGWGEIEPKEFIGKYDSSAPSCCEVILNDPLRLRFKNEAHMQEIVRGISICDYALYSTPNEPYDITKWYSAMRMSLMEDGSDAYMEEIIKLFLYMEPSFKALTKNIIPDIASWRAHKVNYATGKGFKKFQACYLFENKIVSFVVPPYEKFDRYFPFKAENDAMYTVYLRDSTWATPPKCYVSVSKNPWALKDPNVSIKELLEVYQFGENSPGGGHQDVGGLVTDTLADAVQVSRELVEKLTSTVVEFEKVQ